MVYILYTNICIFAYMHTYINTYIHMRPPTHPPTHRLKDVATE